MSNDKINQKTVEAYAQFISKQVGGNYINESEGQMHDSDGIQHVVIHHDGKNHLTMTHASEEPGAIAFHGKIDGHKIRVDSEGDNGRDPTHKDIEDDLKNSHPDLPSHVHKKVMNIIKSGMKKYH
jgi:hypothetical protein